jgi:hypothetical protein
MPTEQAVQRAPGVRALSALLVLARPGKLFARVEDAPFYGWALVAILVLVSLLGFLEVRTGLIDRSIDQRTEEALATLENNQGHLVDRIELRDRMEVIRKGGEFNKMLARLGVVVFTPARFLVSWLLIASLLYVMVAMTGRKPEYHTLLAICVFAGMVEFLGCIVRLGMVVAYRTTFVDTSLAMLAPVGMPTPLAGIDPFSIWFWVLVGIGLTVTRQLSRRVAIGSCLTMALLASGGRIAISYMG